MTKKFVSLVPAVVLVTTALIITACGGGHGPTGPSGTGDAPPPPPSSVLMEFVRDNGGALANATVSVNGMAIGQTANDGRITLTVKPGDAIAVTSPCIQMNTFYRTGATTLVANCQEQDFVRQFLFDGYDNPGALVGLIRPKPDVEGGKTASMNLIVDTPHQALSLNVLQAAAADAMNDLDENIILAVGSGRIPIHISVNPSDPYFQSNTTAGAYAPTLRTNGWITEARIIFKDLIVAGSGRSYTVAEAVALLGHEIGHCEGKWHHNHHGRMNPSKVYTEGFQSEEHRGSSFALFRLPGTRYADVEPMIASSARNGWVVSGEICSAPSR